MRLVSVGNPEVFAKIRGSEVSLTACLFLALADREASNAHAGTVASAISSLDLPGLKSAIRCLASTGEQVSPSPFGTPPFDLYRVNSKADLLFDEWVLFYDRFYRSAAQGRISPALKGVSGVLAEMADNITWHASPVEGQACLGVAGFHVSGDVAAFCVADYGQGFLSSLKREHRWEGLRSEDEALHAVVHRQATSRPGEETGGGFKRLFRSLLDFNGLVILRSGNCTYRLENTVAAGPLITRHIGSPVVGSSVTVIVSRQGKPIEQPMKFI